MSLMPGVQRKDLNTLANESDQTKDEAEVTI